MKEDTIEICKNPDGSLNLIIELTAVFKERSGGITVAFPQIKVFGFSQNSREEALIDAKENASIFFDVHIEDGTLIDALNEFGWKLDYEFKDLSKRSPYPSFEFQVNRKSNNSTTANISIPLAGNMSSGMAYA